MIRRLFNPRLLLRGLFSLAMASGLLLPAADGKVASAASLSCHESRLVVTWRGSTGGLAGHGGELFWVRNEGSAVCRLSGYPVVSFETGAHVSPFRNLDVKGRGFYGPTGIGAHRSFPVVRLAPNGGLASFWVFSEDVMPPCPVLPTVVVEFRGVAGYQSVPVPKAYSAWPVCGTEVDVLPILPGDSGSIPPISLHGLES
jgi:Protein of unknown function (DUF4232)